MGKIYDEVMRKYAEDEVELNILFFDFQAEKSFHSSNTKVCIKMIQTFFIAIILRV